MSNIFSNKRESFFIFIFFGHILGEWKKFRNLNLSFITAEDFFVV
jgi:hypothetical protein